MPKCVGVGAALAGWLALSWAAGGCAQKGDNRFIYLRGATPRPLVKASVPGAYALFPEDSATPKFTIDLAAGDSYGFRKREDETVVAVARDKEIELGDRFVPSYYWAPPKAPKSDQPGK